MSYNLVVAPHDYLLKIKATPKTGIFTFANKSAKARPRFEEHLKAFPEEKFVVGRISIAYFAIPWEQAIKELYFDGRTWEEEWKLLKGDADISILYQIQVSFKGANAIQAYDVANTFYSLLKSHHRQNSNPEKNDEVKAKIADLTEQLEKLRAFIGAI